MDAEEQLRDHQLVRRIDACAAVADAALIEHVVAVLLTNAAKHTPRGSRVTVTVAAEPDGGVCVAVEDDGPGIGERERRLVADQFFRGGHTLRRESSGLGLGLTIASAILAQHDSELEVGTSPDGGASFAFRLAGAPDTPTT